MCLVAEWNQSGTSWGPGALCKEHFLGEGLAVSRHGLAVALVELPYLRQVHLFWAGGYLRKILELTWARASELAEVAGQRGHLDSAPFCVIQVLGEIKKCHFMASPIV